MKIRKIVKIWTSALHWSLPKLWWMLCCVQYLIHSLHGSVFCISSSHQELEQVLYSAIFGFTCVWLRSKHSLCFPQWLALPGNLFPSQWEYSQFYLSKKQVKLLICKCVSFGPLVLLIHQLILQHRKHDCSVGKVLKKLLKPLYFMT